MKTIIHINRNQLRSNIKHGTDKPCITTKTHKSNQYGYKVDILDEKGKVVASVIHSKKPLNCGARCWIECLGNVKILKKRK